MVGDRGVYAAQSQLSDCMRKREFDRLRAAEYRARKKARADLPKRITNTRRQGDELVKVAKGLGKGL